MLFEDAAKFFTQLNNDFPENRLYEYRLGICEVNTIGNEKKGLNHLLNLIDRNDGDDFDDYSFHLANGYYYDHQFEKAKVHYEKYLSHVESRKDEELTKYVNLRLKYNENALRLSADSLKDIAVANEANPINSTDWEYSPFITPDESTMIFTYRGSRSKGGKMNPALRPDPKRGRYYEDVMISYRNENGEWDVPNPIGNINTLENDACVGISHGGDKIFIFKSSDADQGDLYVSNHIDDTTWSKPARLKGDINTPYWEGAAALTNDGKTLYFASERPGGLGGKDLYTATLAPDGTWGNIQNLGPKINSEYDEDSPYIHPDRKTLYFSSNDERSMGNYDVFYTIKNDNGSWSDAKNVGLPVNSLKDDRFYTISADGQIGYYSKQSTRESGDQDIYDVSPGMLGDLPLLALISGKVFLDDQHEKATIVIRNLETGEIEGTYKTNPKTNLFSMLVNPGKKYSIDIISKGETQYTDTLDSDFIDRFIKLQHDYHLYSDDYHGEIPVLQITLQDHVQHVYDEQSGIEKDEHNYGIVEAIVTTKEDTIRFHELTDIVKQNRIDFYQENEHLAEQDNITSEQLDEAEKQLEEKTNNLTSTNNLAPTKNSSTTSTSNGNESSSNNNSAVNTPKEEEHAVFNPVFTKDEIVYRVQVGAYRKPENYHWEGQETYGNVLEVAYDDGITRFTIGGTKYFNEAKSLRLRLIEYGVKDAFIVSFKGGERIPLYEAIKETRTKK